MKFRITMVSALALGSAMVVSAGQIQVGGTNGLTNTPTVVASCSGGCTDQNNYDEVLFNGLTNGVTPPQPYSTYNTNSANVGTIVDTGSNAVGAAGPGGVTFSMINDGTNNNECSQTCITSNNYWSLNGFSANQTAKILVGVYGVTDVWTMINTALASAQTAGDRSVNVTLDFGPTQTGAVTDAVLIKFVNSNDIGSSPNGQSQNAIACGLDPCNGIATPASGLTISSVTITPVTQAGNPGPPTYNPITLVSDNLFSYAYNSFGNGTLQLNDQGMILGTLIFPNVGTNLNTYLENIKIQEQSGPSFAGESLALSAITVDTAAPEPSTVIMFLTGLGAIGLTRFRRSKS
jgi:hypothetical protein